MQVFNVKNNVYSIGVSDKGLRVFDIMMETKHGSTYNSYLIKEEGGVTIIDGVKAQFTAKWLDNIRSLVAIEDIKYLVVQHTEPDHSGAIPALLALNPNIEVYGSFMAMANLKEINNASFKSNVVRPKQELKLSERQSLFFHPVPNVHWPDTIITHDPLNAIAFTCDFLGQHIAPPQLRYSQEKNKQIIEEEIKLYYDAIMAPFKNDALKSVATLKSLDVSMVLNSHGYILDTKEAVDWAVDKYIKWSTVHKSDKLTVTVVFASAYGYTKSMKDVVVDELLKAAALVHVFEVPNDDLATIVTRIEESDALLVASPTFVGDGIKPIYDVLNSLNPVMGYGKYFSAFGSFGWSGEAIRNYMNRASELRFKIIDEGFKVRLKPSEKEFDDTRLYARNFISKVKAELNK
ncbi:MAG: Flavo-diiron protein FprA1 [Tenericutes bacterium ADurb.Bin087]|nr:MAG: Flavo-diiron protein FprA1 [Tenericutes bacterium ADurb.Bin087]